MNENDWLSAIQDYIKNYLAGTQQSRNDGYLYAKWFAAESADTNLSVVTLADGSQLRGIPKLAQVTGLVTGDLIILAGAGSSKTLFILGKRVGDIRIFG